MNNIIGLSVCHMALYSKVLKRLGSANGPLTDATPIFLFKTQNKLEKASPLELLC